MEIITISREFSSGGRELGKRLADLTGYDYYDSEIIYTVAKNIGVAPDYVENTLSNHGWQNLAITYSGTLSSTTYVRASRVQVLVEQKKAIEQIAALGRDCIIVGRNADMILQDYQPFNIFVCAEMKAKVRRCMERALEGEKLTEKELIRKMKQIDKIRSQTRELMGGSDWGRRDSYHLTINTTDWKIKDLVPAVADFADRWFGRKE